jgi:hypothetical protein
MAPKAKPLRYRIDSKAEKLDELDQLESELRANRNSMCEDDYHHLASVLKQRRDKLTKDATQRPPGESTIAPSRWDRLAYGLRSKATERAFQAVLASVVFLWLFWPG